MRLFVSVDDDPAVYAFGVEEGMELNKTNLSKLLSGHPRVAGHHAKARVSLAFLPGHGALVYDGLSSPVRSKVTPVAANNDTLWIVSESFLETIEEQRERVYLDDAERKEGGVGAAIIATLEGSNLAGGDGAQQAWSLRLASVAQRTRFATLGRLPHGRVELLQSALLGPRSPWAKPAFVASFRRAGTLERVATVSVASLTRAHRAGKGKKGPAPLLHLEDGLVSVSGGARDAAKNTVTFRLSLQTPTDAQAKVVEVRVPLSQLDARGQYQGKADAEEVVTMVQDSLVPVDVESLPDLPDPTSTGPHLPRHPVKAGKATSVWTGVTGDRAVEAISGSVAVPKEGSPVVYRPSPLVVELEADKVVADQAWGRSDDRSTFLNWLALPLRVINPSESKPASLVEVRAEYLTADFVWIPADKVSFDGGASSVVVSASGVATTEVRLAIEVHNRGGARQWTTRRRVHYSLPEPLHVRIFLSDAQWRTSVYELTYTSPPLSLPTNESLDEAARLSETLLLVGRVLCDDVNAEGRAYGQVLHNRRENRLEVTLASEGCSRRTHYLRRTDALAACLAAKGETEVPLEGMALSEHDGALTGAVSVLCVWPEGGRTPLIHGLRISLTTTTSTASDSFRVPLDATW